MNCEFLEECVEGYERSEARIDRLYADLSRNQLRWRPAENGWSVVQCIDHLAKVRNLHLERLTKAVRVGRAKNISGGTSPYGRGTVLGRMLLKSFTSTKRFKTIKRFQAGPEPDAAETREFFRRLNGALIALATEADGLDLGRIKVGAPPSPLVRLSLAQGFRLHVLHDDRHLGQAEALKNEPGFPAS